MDVTQDLENIALNVKELETERNLLGSTTDSMLNLFAKIYGETDIRLIHHDVVPSHFSPTVVLRGDRYAGIIDISEYGENRASQRAIGLSFDFTGSIDGQFVKAGCNVMYAPVGFQEGKNLISVMWLDQEALQDYYALFFLRDERNSELHSGEQALFYEKPIGFRVTDGIAKKIDPHRLEESTRET